MIFFRALSTYETATTRKYFNGRTETVRSCTEEALKLAKAVVNQDQEINDQVVISIYKIADILKH